MPNEIKPFYIPLNRRRFMRAIYLASAGFTLPGFLAEALGTVAPSVTQGPYYSLADDSPLDNDNNLVQLTYTAVPGTTTGEVQAAFDFQVNLTPVEPTYPVAGGFIAKGVPVAGPSTRSPSGPRARTSACREPASPRASPPRPASASR